MTRVINFSSGPATLPQSVLQQAAHDMMDWRGSGMSVMEMSHRGPEFTEILAQTQSLIRSLLNVPDNYIVLLLQGGAIAENAIVPMNLIGKTGQADYVVSGVWSEKSMKEAGKYGQIHLAASSKDSGFLSMPQQSSWKLSAQAAYVHMQQRNHRRRGMPLDAGHRFSAVGGRHVVQHHVWASRCGSLWFDLRRCTKKHGAFWRDLDHRKARFVGSCIARHAFGFQLPVAGRAKLYVQHAADLRDLHHGSGVATFKRAGRFVRHASAQPTKS